jgi:hypothetical protein
MMQIVTCASIDLVIAKLGMARTLRCTVPVDYHLFNKNNNIIVICGVSFQVSRRFPPGEERAE